MFGVLDGGGGAGLAAKAVEGRGIVLEVDGRHLDGHPPAQLRIDSQVDRAHAALTQLLQDTVAPKLRRHRHIGHGAPSE